MNKPYIALIRCKFKNVISTCRRQYLKYLGLKIGTGGTIGEIICEWPHNVIIGSDCTIQDRVRFDVKNPFSGNNFISIGNRVFLGYECAFNCTATIFIGDDCLIANRTTFVDISHTIALGTVIHEQPIISSAIVIEQDVWVGTGSIILKGVTIGKGSIIGAGSLVNKSIPAYQMWAGSPARYIRDR